MGPESPPEVLAICLGCLFQAQRANWERKVESPWVLATVLGGYKLQFQCRPPSYRGIWVTSVENGVRKDTLWVEIASLLSKDAIRKVELLEQLSGFYSTYFIVPKKDDSFRLILILHGLNKCLKELKFKMLTPARVSGSLERPMVHHA
jgi:hypothetical protein